MSNAISFEIRIKQTNKKEKKTILGRVESFVPYIHRHARFSWTITVGSFLGMDNLEPAQNCLSPRAIMALVETQLVIH